MEGFSLGPFKANGAKAHLLTEQGPYLGETASEEWK